MRSAERERRPAAGTVGQHGGRKEVAVGKEGRRNERKEAGSRHGGVARNGKGGRLQAQWKGKEGERR